MGLKKHCLIRSVKKASVSLHALPFPMTMVWQLWENNSIKLFIDLYGAYKLLSVIIMIAIPVFEHKMAQFFCLFVFSWAMEVHHICVQDLTWGKNITRRYVRTYQTRFCVEINFTIHHHVGTADSHSFPLQFFASTLFLSPQTIRLPFSVSLREAV